MDLNEAREILNSATRSENRDHYFGDREVYWDKDGEEVASGYFGGTAREVTIIISRDNPSENQPMQTITFEGDEAYELVKCGASVDIGRNDSTGPDRYAGA